MNNFHFSKYEKIALALAALVLLGLFISSSMTYNEQKLQPGFTNHYLKWLENIVGNWNIYYAGKWHNSLNDGGVAAMAEFVLRKAAHFGSYLLLGLFSYIGFRRLSRIRWIGVFSTWFFCVAMAAFDEYHQYLTGDRTPSVHDVMLDSLGSLTGIIIMLIVYYFVAEKRKQSK